MTINNYRSDHHKMFGYRDFEEFVDFLDYAISIDHRIILTKIERQPGAFVTKYNKNLGPGIDIQLDNHRQYQLNHLNLDLIKIIVSYRDEVKKLFENGIDTTDCNCAQWTSVNWFGDCPLTVMNVNDKTLRCDGCETIQWCCRQRNLRNIRPDEAPRGQGIAVDNSKPPPSKRSKPN